MEFSIEKCAMLIIKNGQRQIMKGTELPRKESECWENLQVLGNIGSTPSNRWRWKKKWKRVSQMN